MSYYNKDVYGKIRLTSEGQYVLDYFGLSTDDLIRMSSEELQTHCKKFSDVLNDGRITKSTGGSGEKSFGGGLGKNVYGQYSRTKSGDGFGGYGDSGSYSRYFDLDKWFDTTFPFLAIPKASSSEKNKGLDKWISKVNDGRQTPIDNPFQRGETVRKNIHPAVKPIKLMSWLVTLLSRPQDTILDPFMGSGTTCIAAKLLKRKYIGIEKELEYLEIARQRINAY